ncbi:MAG: hypothetical protein KBA51_03840 [Kiritimatiellae bacterium]|nr:hypothetical protein [Kiritimatiellia bacterium]
MSAPPTPIAPGRASRWVIPAAVSTVAHIGWLVAFGIPEAPTGPAEPREASPAHVVFTPAHGGEMDARWLGSPVIFSMPGGLGAARASGTGARPPPVTIPEDPPPLLVRTPEPAREAVLPATGLRMTPIWQMPAPRSNPPPLPAFLAERLDAAGGLPADWRFDWADEHGGKNSWEAELFIKIGDDGQPASVMVDSADAPESARLYMSRTAYGWRLPASASPATVRIRVRYTPVSIPSAQPAADSGSDAGATP